MKNTSSGSKNNDTPKGDTPQNSNTTNNGNNSNSNNGNSSNNNNTSSPATGDNSGVLSPTALLALSSTVIFALKKRKSE